MKYYIVFFVVLAAIAVAESEGKGCNGQDDCDEDECCVMKFIPFRKGNCKKRGTEGQMCSEEDDIISYFDKFAMACPCSDGHECIAEEKTTKNGMTTKKNPKCRVPPTEEPEEPSTEEPEEGGDGEGGDGGEGGDDGGSDEGGEGENGSEEVSEA